MASRYGASPRSVKAGTWYLAPGTWHLLVTHDIAAAAPESSYSQRRSELNSSTLCRRRQTGDRDHGDVARARGGGRLLTVWHPGNGTLLQQLRVSAQSGRRIGLQRAAIEDHEADHRAAVVHQDELARVSIASDLLPELRHGGAAAQ